MTLSVGDFVILRDTAAGQHRAIKVSPDWRNNSKRNHVLLPVTASGSAVAVGASLGPHEVDDEVILGLTAAAAQVAINAHPDMTLPSCDEYAGDEPDDSDCCTGQETHTAEVSGAQGSWGLAQAAWAEDIIDWWEGLGGTYTEGAGERLNNEQPFREDDEWTMPCNLRDGGEGDDICNCDDPDCEYTLVQACAEWDHTQSKWIGRAVLNLSADNCDCVDVTCNDCDPKLPDEIAVTLSGFGGDMADMNGTHVLSYTGLPPFGCTWQVIINPGLFGRGIYLSWEGGDQWRIYVQAYEGSLDDGCMGEYRLYADGCSPAGTYLKFDFNCTGSASSTSGSVVVS